MKSKTVLFFLGLAYIGLVECDIEFRAPGIPPISAFVNRITNTTFGVLRGGLNIFSRTVDRIINTFNRVEDRLRELLEEFRKQIVRGIPELSIPILDPLHIDKVEFNIAHEAAGLKGKVEDVTVRHISKFVIDGEKFSDLGNLRFQLDLNLTFPSIAINGFYDVNGLIGEMFKIFGHGKFWLNLIDFKLGISAQIQFEYPLRLRLTSLDLNVKLGKLENYFDNLMEDPELEVLFNQAASRIAPEALDILWPDLKGPIEQQIMTYVNTILENATIANIVRRIFNII